MDRIAALDLAAGDTVIVDDTWSVLVIDTVDAGHSVLVKFEDGATQWLHCGRLR